MKRVKGFTLIELVICIAIIGIISGLVIPSTKFIYDTRLKVDARNLLTDIRYIKNLTGSTGIEYKITFKTNGYEITDENTNLIRKYEFNKGVTLSDLELSRGPLKVNYLTYTTDGNPSSSGKIKISNKNKTIDISIVPVTGRVAIIN